MTDQLGPDFDDRLGAELDRVTAPTPLPANARFNLLPSGYRPFTGRKVALAVAGALAIVMVGATALARSPNPAVWVSTVQSVTHVGESGPSPSPESQPKAEPQPPAPAEPTTTAEPSHQASEPSPDTHSEPLARPTPSPEHDHQSPRPEHGYSGSPSPSPSPSGSEH